MLNFNGFGRKEYPIRYGYLSALLALALAVGPVGAGRYDEPGFLLDHLVSGGPPKDGIPALTNPAFVAPGEIGYVQEDDVVMGLVINGEPRAYPHNIGWWNEIINDRAGNQSVTVSLCPLTGTGQVFNATDGDGSQIEFGVSGLLVNSNLVMYDRRDGPVRLSVYNAAGQRVRVLVEGYQSRGLYLQRWDGRDDAGEQVASGTYLYQLEVPVAGFSKARTMALVR